MKAKLTNRRHVFAEGPWYNVGVTETTVTVRTDFGVVTVNRNNRGLEVTLRPNDPNETVVQLDTGALTFTESDKPEFRSDAYSAMLRPIGQFQMGEITKHPVMHELSTKWMVRKGQQNAGTQKDKK